MVEIPPQRRRQLENLIERLGLSHSAFQRWDLLDQALTHASVSATWNYEQLEFVGDAVVRLAVAEFLQRHHAGSSVGEWSAVRSVLVSDHTLAQIADSYGLERFLITSAGAVADPGGQSSRMAEAFEALLGVLYLSTGDMRLIAPWLDIHWQEWVTAVRADPAYQNYKAALQVWTQAHLRSLPEYRVEEVATATHTNKERRFYAQVWIQGQQRGEGWGASMKAAEKMAAQQAYQALAQTSEETSA
jgi:ribonuclease-3